MGHTDCDPNRVRALCYNGKCTGKLELFEEFAMANPTITCPTDDGTDPYDTRCKKNRDN